MKTLDQKAVLVRLRRRMYAPFKRDVNESKKYGAGNVNKHLFEGKHNRVKEVLRCYSDVYTYTKAHTVPWLDDGTDLLNIELYDEFTAGLRARIDAANKAVDDLVANWDEEVQVDLARLQAIDVARNDGVVRANLADYPTAEEVRSKFGITVRFAPVPTTGDFRVGISEEDRASLQAELDEVEQNAARHVVLSLLEPMQKAVEKLAVPIGVEGPGGATFRDSLILNISEVADRMTKANISNDPQLTERIRDLQAVVQQYAGNIDVLRESPTVRTKAKDQISELMSKMAGLV